MNHAKLGILHYVTVFNVFKQWAHGSYAKHQVETTPNWRCNSSKKWRATCLSMTLGDGDLVSQEMEMTDISHHKTCCPTWLKLHFLRGSGITCPRMDQSLPSSEQGWELFQPPAGDRMDTFGQMIGEKDREVKHHQTTHLAGWWFLTILKNISQWEGLSHILWKIKNVWNHQPLGHCCPCGTI